MSALEKEIEKYTKRGFEVRQKRTLEHGKTVYLYKKQSGIGGWMGGFEGIYIYYVDGDSNTKNIREFLEDYSRFHEKKNFGEGDKGIFMCSGRVDKGLFRDLRKAMVQDDDINSTIFVRTLDFLISP